MLTKTQLQELVNKAYHETRSSDFDLYYCKATYKFVYINDVRCAILKSYGTIVAVYSHATGTVYALNRYSMTTTQHIYKFCKLMNASRLVKLYRDTTNEFQVNFSERGLRAGAYRESNQILSEIEARDYYGLIESFTKR